jgi:hypothetical protein
VSLVVPAQIPEESAADFQAALLTTLEFLQKKYPSIAYLNGYKGAPLPVKLGAVNEKLEIPFDVVETTEELLTIVKKPFAAQHVPEEAKQQNEKNAGAFSGNPFGPETALFTQQMMLNEKASEDPVNPDSSKMAPTMFKENF